VNGISRVFECPDCGTVIEMDKSICDRYYPGWVSPVCSGLAVMKLTAIRFGCGNYVLKVSTAARAGSGN